MSSELVVMYQREVEEAIGLVKSQKIPAGDWRAAEDLLKQSQETLKLMEQEARSARNAHKKDVSMVSVNSLRREIDSLMDEVRKNSLLNRSRIGSDDDVESGRLLEPDEGERDVLKRSHDALLHSRRVLGEIQETGVDIQKNLSTQNDSISSVHGKVKNTNTLATEGRNILRNIERTEMRNKICAYGAVIAVFIGVVVAIYWILFRT